MYYSQAVSGPLSQASVPQVSCAQSNYTGALITPGKNLYTVTVFPWIETAASISFSKISLGLQFKGWVLFKRSATGYYRAACHTACCIVLLTVWSRHDTL